MFLPTNITLKFGDSGDFVSELQRRLSVVKCFSESMVNGFYDGNTANGVSRFQSMVGINADGIAGPETLRRLNGAISGDFASGGGTNNTNEAEEEERRRREAEAARQQEFMREQQRLNELEQQRLAEQQQVQAAAVQQTQPSYEPAPPVPQQQPSYSQPPAYVPPQPAPQAPTAPSPAEMLAQMIAQPAAQPQQPAPAIPTPPSPTQSQPAPYQAAPAPQQPYQPPELPQATQAPQAAPEQPRGIVGRAMQYANEVVQKLATYFESKLPRHVIDEVKQIGHAMASSGVKEAPIPQGPEQQRDRGIEQQRGTQQGRQLG